VVAQPTSRGAVFRFIHSSDLHLGKPFGRFPEDVRVRLRQARAEALRTLADLARLHNASHILLAGDTFDQMTPAPTVIRQALNAMAAADTVTWVILPGNHDHANATELWRQVARDAPGNVTVASRPDPMALNSEVTLLPAPPTERHPGRDLTEWFDTADTGDRVRIGLAHGSIRGFSTSEEGGSSILSPDRARDAGLAYLGLGDWHGQLKITDTTWYSGAPEADGFKHDHAPAALLVEIAGPNAPAIVTPLPTARLEWRAVGLEITGDPVEGVGAGVDALDRVLPPVADRQNTLLFLRVTGRAYPAARIALEQGIMRNEPDFLWAESDLSGLGMAYEVSDLDEIDRQGALRAAADALDRDAKDEARTPEDRATAEAALSYLFSYAAEQ